LTRCSSGCRSCCHSGCFTRRGSCYDPRNDACCDSSYVIRSDPCCDIRSDACNDTCYGSRSGSCRDSNNSFSCGSSRDAGCDTSYGSSNDIRYGSRYDSSYDSSYGSCQDTRQDSRPASSAAPESRLQERPPFAVQTSLQCIDCHRKTPFISVLMRISTEPAKTDIWQRGETGTQYELGPEARQGSRATGWLRRSIKPQAASIKLAQAQAQAQAG
jgi:hypothetical protein